MLALSVQMAETLARGNAAPPPPPAPGQPQRVTDDDFIQRPLEAAERVADARVTAALTPALEGLKALTTANAATTRMIAAQQYKDTFDKWGPEIDQAMAGVSSEHRTLENYAKVVDYVRGKHINEIAQEMAKQMVAGGALGERSGGAGGVTLSATQGFNVDKLRPDTQEYIRKHGLTAQHVAEFCKANGWTEEKFMTEMLNNKLFTQDSPFSFMLKEEALGATRQFA